MTTRLGQNFLISALISKKIAEAANIGKKDVVLEIGPGKGILTKYLLDSAKKVIAVEKDKRLFEFLDEKFKESKNLELINADIRDVLKNPDSYGFRPKNYKVVANIPYYLTGQLLRLLLTPKVDDTPFSPFGDIVLMVQKEVALRIISSPDQRKQAGQPLGLSRGKMSILAVSVQVFADPKIAFFVPKKHFKPQPKVDSAVIVLTKRPKNVFKKEKIDQKVFFNVVKTGFLHKRKLLLNNLKGYANTKEVFPECQIPPLARAEELSIKNWICLVKRLKK